MDLPKPYIITIIGPESSGKTTLARELAGYMGCSWVPEYARQFLEGLDRPYEQRDLEAIAEGQLALLNRKLEDGATQLAIGSDQSSVFSKKLAENIPPSAIMAFMQMKESRGGSILSFELDEFGEESRPILIVDSGMLSLRLWARIKYGTSIPIVDKAMAEDVTSMYILCRPVYPWAPDPQREAPSLLERAWIYNHYLKEVSAIRSK